MPVVILLRMYWKILWFKYDKNDRSKNVSDTAHLRIEKSFQVQEKLTKNIRSEIFESL